MIPIIQEPEGSGLELETCCFCDEPTPMWTNLPNRSESDQVACCPNCAETYNQKEVPTKEDWCRRCA